MGFVGDFVGELTGANDAADAAEEAGRLQAQQSAAGIAEQRRQFDKLVELMSPFVSQGTQAMGSQAALLGLSGPDAQQAAIQGIESSPQFTSLVQQGENALLQNSAATGGLRGGNTQSALASMRPQLLSALIESQYSKLGGLTSIGQASAAGQASAGMQSAGAISDLLAQQGAAQAGAALAAGGARRAAFGDILGAGKIISGFF